MDFSGAKSDQHTWLASGISEGSILYLHDCRPVPRTELTDLLANTVTPTVAALDFPFSVPQPFAQFWEPAAAAMPHLWAAARNLSQDDFISLRNQFVAEQGEPKRLADTHHPEAYSCLHVANPNMVPMTFRGMQMLNQLWEAGCSVPPLIDADQKGALLLEAMPGAALKSFGLPYKGYKNGSQALQLRQQILERLSEASTIEIQGLAELRDQCLVSHDCLDAVVAAVVATLWNREPALFRRPVAEGQPGFDPVVMLEGWLYAPVFIQEQV